MSRGIFVLLTIVSGCSTAPRSLTLDELAADVYGPHSLDVHAYYRGVRDGQHLFELATYDWDRSVGLMSTVMAAVPAGEASPVEIASMYPGHDVTGILRELHERRLANSR